MSTGTTLCISNRLDNSAAYSSLGIVEGVHLLSALLLGERIRGPRRQLHAAGGVRAAPARHGAQRARARAKLYLATAGSNPGGRPVSGGSCRALEANAVGPCLTDQRSRGRWLGTRAWSDALDLLYLFACSYFDLFSFTRQYRLLFYCFSEGRGTTHPAARHTRLSVSLGFPPPRLWVVRRGEHEPRERCSRCDLVCADGDAHSPLLVLLGLIKVTVHMSVQ